MCYSIAKYLLFIFNFAFWLAGAALLGVGIWINVDPSIAESIEVIDAGAFYVGAYVLIAAGSIMLVVGFFGCCGAIKESTCLLGTYFVFLFVIFALQIGIGIWAFVNYDSVDQLVYDGMNAIDPSTLTNTSSLCATQQNFKCCGTVNNCTDWNGNIEGGSLKCGCDVNTEPAGTCVPASDLGCQVDKSATSTTDYVYKQPCSTAVSQFLQDNILIVGVIGLTIGLAEILGMIVAMCLCSSIKDKNKSHAA